MCIHPLALQFVAAPGHLTPPTIGYPTPDLVAIQLFTLKVYPHPVRLGVENVLSVLSVTHILSTLELRLPALSLLSERIFSHTGQQPMYRAGRQHSRSQCAHRLGHLPEEPAPYLIRGHVRRHLHHALRYRRTRQLLRLPSHALVEREHRLAFCVPIQPAAYRNVPEAGHHRPVVQTHHSQA